MMYTRRMAARRLEDERVDEEIPPQVEQVHQGAQVVKVPIKDQRNEVEVVPPGMNREIREALVSLYRALTTHMNRVLHLE